MAVDKLVDSTQLDTDLTSVANAIRTKGGTSASLAFPAGFVSAIQAIPTGGGDPNENLVKRITNALTSIDIDVDGGSVIARAFDSCSNLVTLHIRGINGFSGSNHYMLNGATNVETVVLEGSGNVKLETNMANSCTKLKVWDMTGMYFYAGGTFGATMNDFKTLIIRDTAVKALGNVNTFNNTPFKSGGSGGTIYIPKSLYDHLGDGGSLDYKAATNWSTVNGYGTITWAKIEGSQYENYYADGTPIT